MITWLIASIIVANTIAVTPPPDGHWIYSYEDWKAHNEVCEVCVLDVNSVEFDNYIKGLK